MNSTTGCDLYVIRAQYLEDEYVLTKDNVCEFEPEEHKILRFKHYQEAEKFIKENLPRCRLFVSVEKQEEQIL